MRRILIGMFIETVLSLVQSRFPCVYRIPQLSSTTSKCADVKNFYSILANSNISRTCQKELTMIRNDGVRFSWDRFGSLPDKAFPVVLNLNELLSQVSKEKCFVMLDNFAEVNIHPTSYPVALRSLELNRACTRTLICYPVWITTGTIPPCSFFYFTSAKSPFSLKFIEHLWPDEVPFRINRTTYVPVAKPWNCQIQIYMYPPNFEFDGVHQPDIELPTIFQYTAKAQIGPSSTNLPTDIFTANFVVYHDWQVMLSNYHRSVQAWSSNMLIEQTGYINELRSFSLLKVTGMYHQRNVPPESKFGDTFVNVKTMEIITMSIYASDIISTISIMKLTDFRFRQEIFTKAFSFELYFAYWEIDDVAKVLAYAKQQLMSCKANWLENGRRIRLEDLLGYAILHVWSSVLQNFTHKSGRERDDCFIGKPTHSLNPYFRLKLRINSRVNFKPKFGNSLTLDIKSATVRFVTCGRRGVEQIGFYELIGFYDWKIWLLVTISVIAVSFLLRFTTHRFSRGIKAFNSSKCWNYVVSTAQILLEQGGDYMSLSREIPQTRITLGPYLLASVVLIAGYKNDNLYNIALPRQPVPYDFMDDLLHDNFSIYSGSRIKTVDFRPTYGKICLSKFCKVSGIMWYVALVGIKVG